MDRETAIARLREMKNLGDTETAHIHADDILCVLLESLGYSDVVAAWQEVPKLYA